MKIRLLGSLCVLSVLGLLIYIWKNESSSSVNQNKIPATSEEASTRVTGGQSTPIENATQSTTASRQQPTVAGDSPTRSNGERPITLQKALNQSAPDWLRSIPPKTLPLAPTDLASKAAFDRPPGIIQIDGKSLSIEERPLDYLHPDTIHWAALSPSGNRVVLGMPSRDPEYKIAGIANNQLEMTSDSLPKLNYFDEQRWWLNDWIWLSDNSLLGLADEEDPTGDSVVSTRLYLYDLATKLLQRLDPPNVPSGAVFKVIGIDRNSRLLKISYSDPKEIVQVVQY